MSTWDGWTLTMTTTRTRKNLTGKKHIHTYSPRGGCKEVMECRDEEVLISGPAGTGKSRACLEKLYLACMLTPKTKCLILRKTLTSLSSSALETWRKYVVKEAMEVGEVVYYGGSPEEPPQYRFRNGSTVVIGGLDKAVRIMSTEYDIVYVQEATEITVDDLEFVKTRLRNWNISYQQLVMDCNPAGINHWLKLRCTEGLCTLIESRHEDNPRLFDLLDDGTYEVTERGAKYIGILDALTGVRYKRLRLGLWVSAEGVVYEEFDPAYKVLPWTWMEADEDGNEVEMEFSIPEDWPRYWSIDFGFAVPFVLSCYAESTEDGALYLYRQIYMTNRTVAEHAKTIMDIVTPEIEISWYDHINRVERSRTERNWIEPEPTAIICDWDAEGRRTFENETGLGTVAAQKWVWEGINAHKQRINDDKFFVMADCLVEKDPYLVEHVLPTCTVDEYPAYAWKVSTDGRIKDEPVKQDDHGMDTDRYMTMYLDFKGSPRVTIID